MEIWRDTIYQGEKTIYEVSDTGQIRNVLFSITWHFIYARSFKNENLRFFVCMGKMYRKKSKDLIFSAPLTHPCGCTILWSCDNDDRSITIMRFFFSNVGKFPCPFCGGETKQEVGNPNIIRMNVHGQTMFCRKTTVSQDIIDGRRNLLITLNFLENMKL